MNKGETEMPEIHASARQGIRDGLQEAAEMAEADAQAAEHLRDIHPAGESRTVHHMEATALRSLAARIRAKMEGE